MPAPTVDLSFVKDYESDVHAAYQRMGTKLLNTVRRKTGVVGSSTTFQKVGKGNASTKARHGRIAPMNLDHSPVECTLVDNYAADYQDKLDDLKIKHSERDVIVNAGAYALGRETDSQIITVLEAATTHQSSAVNLSAITTATMIGMVTALGDRDVPVDDGQTFGVVSWQTWGKMMTLQEFSNSQWIGDGDLPFSTGIHAKRWMGVIWMPHSGLTLATNARKALVFHKTAIGHATGADVTSDITWQGERAAWFINNMMSMGACLIDTIGVQQLVVTENA
jgi:hypothetical protein